MKQRTVGGGLWYALTRVFRSSTGGGSKTVGCDDERSAKDSGRRRRRRHRASETGRDDDDYDDDDDDDDGKGDGRDGDEDGDSAAARAQMAELKLDIVNVLHAECKRKNERAVGWLADAKRENCRLTVVVCGLETKVSELGRQTARAERRAERLAERRIDAAARRADHAERRAEQAKRQAEQAERLVERLKRRAEQVAEETAARRAVLLRAVADMQGVLSSRVVDLRIDALRTALDKIEDALGATADDGTADDGDDLETEEDGCDP